MQLKRGGVTITPYNIKQMFYRQLERFSGREGQLARNGRHQLVDSSSLEVKHIDLPCLVLAK